MRYTLLYGEHQLTIDEKNRVLVPAEIRRTLESANDSEALFAIIGVNLKPWLYPARYYFERMEQTEPDLTPDDDQQAYDQLNFAMANRLPIDKQGRILIPELTLSRTNTGRNVFIVGTRDHLEIWNVEDWNQRQLDLLKNASQINGRAQLRKRAGDLK